MVILREWGSEIGVAQLLRRGAEDAEICEIIDHHRMGAEKTSTPIYIYSKPIGSTCSIVYSHYRMAGIEPDQATSLLMLSGLLSRESMGTSLFSIPRESMSGVLLEKELSAPMNLYAG